MTDHTHTALVPGCYRCELNKDEQPDRLWTDNEGYKVAELLTECVPENECWSDCVQARASQAARILDAVLPAIRTRWLKELHQQYLFDNPYYSEPWLRRKAEEGK